MMQAFIREHREEDVRQLALKGAQYPDIDMTYALQQIAGWQTARKKLPTWAATGGIVYPPHLSMEQCSSEETADYKMRLCRRIIEKNGSSDESMVDLTGGFGVDFSFLARMFRDAVYVEQQAQLCDAAAVNFKLLGLNQARIIQGDGVDYLHKMDKVRMIYLDPARRDAHGGRAFAISDCSPDVVSLCNELLEKAEWVMVKLSPMLDWHKAVEDLGRENVREVHIVSVNNECKELLIVMSRQHQEQPFLVCCVNDGQTFAFSHGAETTRHAVQQPLEECRYATPVPSVFLYEPNASILKAGCFEELQRRFHVRALGRNSHLFISSDFIEDFPGRRFQISAISSMNKKDVKSLLKGIDKANITVRNFPLSVAELRKRLKLKDGGTDYLFATTTEGGKHLLMLAKRVFSDAQAVQ
ncbi:MAG: SAM-dependent methyltransferase [Prevotella sp.]|nr:SAM-dependent methyltransferase [Prevotella sp.]